jgi:hypothetical protein
LLGVPVVDVVEGEGLGRLGAFGFGVADGHFSANRVNGDDGRTSVTSFIRGQGTTADRYLHRLILRRRH